MGLVYLGDCLSKPFFSHHFDDALNDLPSVYVLSVKHKESGIEIAKLLVQRIEEIDNFSATHTNARLSIFYRVLAHGLNPDNGVYVFEACYSSAQNRVSLTSHNFYSGNVFISINALRGHRVGSHFMSEVVKWASRWPDADVKPISLSPVDAHPDNKVRRNRFYEQFGFTFNDDIGGKSNPIKVAGLTQCVNWQRNIDVLPLLPLMVDAFKTIDKQNTELAYLQSTVNALGDKLNYRRGNSTVIALKAIADFCFRYFVVLLAIAYFFYIAWQFFSKSAH